MKRRTFIKNASLSGAGVAIGSSLISCAETASEEKKIAVNPPVTGPVVIATWDVKNATSKAWEVLSADGNALDAIEQGCMI
ncbi:MAG: glycosylasparaginase, partial [Flavobacteriaceae bacterium]|nr:glycosylasparaginase [Flavobacteriaceae bacterium]